MLLEFKNIETGEKKEVSVENVTESEFYRAVAKVLVTFEPKCTVAVACEIGKAQYTVQLRSGTILVSEVSNSFTFAGKPNYPHVYLTCVEFGLNDYTGRDKNHYKFYELEQNSDEVVATYGRIGVSAGEKYGERSCKYPLSMFWIKYEEKIAKGYKDKTEIYLTEEVPEKAEPSQQQEKKRVTMAQKLFKQLQSFCKSHVERSCKSTKITKGMVSESKRLLNELYDTKSVEEFNQTLVELLAISPRRVNQVYELLAEDEKDYSEITQREEDLIKAMEGLVTVATPEDEHPFQDIRIKKVTDEDRDKINELLAPELKGKVTGTWKVVSKRFDERFKTYCKDHHITNTKLLWHGSRNENWLSIINNGLLLNPSAVITGKMFGNGIYFAPSCMKSWGYTSSRGSYWAKGCDDVAFMGIYETAYGTPQKVQYAQRFTQADLLRNGKNCVHAERGGALRNDEIVYYSESAMVLKYLVRFSA